MTINNETMDVWHLIPPNRRSLAKLRRISLRNKSWFKFLSNTERSLINAVVIVVDRIRSFLLRRLLKPIIQKLLKATNDPQKTLISIVGEVAYWMQKKGKSLAQSISQIGLGWGYKSAGNWVKDKGFIQFLTIMDLNNPRL